tara:strand:+ start:22342 stop:23667 length:1326 start_codon:yes stop_codon:yes gene_type:complete
MVKIIIKSRIRLCEQKLPTDQVKVLYKSLRNKKLDKQQKAYNSQKLALHYKATGNTKFANYYQKHYERLTNSGRANKDFAVGKFFLNLSNAVHKKTGVRIMDPSAVKNPPKWAKEYPSMWAALQTVADFTLSDPFTASVMLIPVAKLGTAGTKALTKVAGQKAGSLASLPVKDVVTKLGPEKSAQFMKFLNSTETKQFAKVWWQELSTLPPAAANKHVSVAYGGGGGIDNVMQAAHRAYRKSVAPGGKPKPMGPANPNVVPTSPQARSPEMAAAMKRKEIGGLEGRSLSRKEIEKMVSDELDTIRSFMPPNWTPTRKDYTDALQKIHSKKRTAQTQLKKWDAQNTRRSAMQRNQDRAGRKQSAAAERAQNRSAAATTRRGSNKPGADKLKAGSKEWEKWMEDTFDNMSPEQWSKYGQKEYSRQMDRLQESKTKEYFKRLIT